MKLNRCSRMFIMAYASVACLFFIVETDMSYTFAHMMKKRREPMDKLLDRSQVDDQYKWNLQHMFPDQTAWDKEYAEVLKLITRVESYKGKLDTVSTVKDCFELEDTLSIKAERLLVYAHMRHDEDTTKPIYQSLSQKAKKLNVQISKALSFIYPEMISLPVEQLDHYIGHPQLANYHFSLELMKRQKAHVLSDTEEALLASVGTLSQAPQTIFNMFNNADLTFPTVKDRSGKENVLTQGNYIQFMENPDRHTRERAFQAMYATYASHKNTMASTLNANVNKNIFYAHTRKYPSVLEMALYGDNVSKEVYTNLIDTVHENLPLLQRYMKLKKKLLGVEQLHMYDLFASVDPHYEMNVTYEQAKAKVKEALQPLGKAYADLLQTSYDNHWIDVYENKNKRSGAYSWGAYGTHPYVLLNHKNNVNSMFTLAHELGHALHSYYSDEALCYRNAQYPIFLAEVASTTNEALLMHDLLKKAHDPKQKLYLLTYYADQFRSTLFRQTMFAEFEKIIHEHAEAGEALTADVLCRLYYDLNVKYYGPTVVVDKDIEMEWARIPHFYNSFYVYKYATGFCAAMSFSKQMLEEGENAVHRYFDFLKSGGSDFPLQILKTAGVDMSTTKPIYNAMSVFKYILDEMEKLTSS